MSASVIRIKPYQYIHVLDKNTNISRVVVGPKTHTVLDHEKVVQSPTSMVMVPPRHYCIVQNPVERLDDNNLSIDGDGQVKVRHGDEEIRFSQDPFPLYPGEKLYGKVSPLQVVAPNTAIRLRAIRDFTNEEGDKYAGDEWLFSGPGTYYPRIEVQVVEIVRATIVLPNQALRIRARKQFVDRNGKERKAGEEWMVRDAGAYLPDVNEEIKETTNAYILTAKKALQLEALRTFVDVFGKKRKAGEQWLISINDAETHIPDVHERVIGEVNITTLNSRQYCVVLDPVDDSGKQAMGSRVLRVGEKNFFLKPGERLENGIQAIHVLAQQEALLLRAREAFSDNSGEEETARVPGDRWMIYGPRDYVPPVTVEIVEKRKAIALDDTEGIYVRDINDGSVRAVSGQVYMLEPYEELYEKDLPDTVEQLLASGRKGSAPRDKTRVVTYRTPHNHAVQIYDYKLKKARVVFGPELIMLGPDEQFTVLSLSGETPKRPHVLKILALSLGPRFSTDIVVVETGDHARLQLKLSYNWHFELDEDDDKAKIFNVPDFVGDFCKAIASRVRGDVAQHSFDDFHKHSADLIRTAVFGNGKNFLKFDSNGLVISNVDIQSVEPVDSRTRDALQKSVQLAIEITTKSQEASAKHEAERREQEARGSLERQKIHDEAKAEEARTSLLKLVADSSQVEATGQATAEAKAKAAAAEIEGAAAVNQAQLKADAQKILSEGEIKSLKLKQDTEIEYLVEMNKLDIERERRLAEIESLKFKNIVKSIGANTIAEIARAGPEMQAKLLSGLGLKSFLITDGNSPINLFNTAKGMVGAEE